MSINMSDKDYDAYIFALEAYDDLKVLNTTYKDKFESYEEYYRGYINKNKYPMLYNDGYNKVLPIIYQQAEGMLTQFYRTADIAGVKPKRRADVQGADRIGALLNNQLAHMNDVDQDGGMYMCDLTNILDTLTYGKGIRKAYWRKEEATRPVRTAAVEYEFLRDDRGELVLDPDGQPIPVPRIVDKVVENNVIIYDGPYIENIHPKLFLPHPEYREIQKMPYLAHVHKKSLDWILKNADNGHFKNVKNIGELGELIRSGHNDVDELLIKRLELEDCNTLKEIQTDRHTANNIEIIEVYAKYSLEGPIVDLDRGVVFKGREEECVITIANRDTVLRVEKVPYGRKPFFASGAHINPHSFWDIGVVELVKGVQENFNVIANLRNQNVMMSINPMVKIKGDEIDPEQLFWRPFGFVNVEEHDDIEMLQIPDIEGKTFENHIQFFDNMIYEMTGMHPYNLGQTPPRQEHVGTMYSLQQTGAARMRLLMMTMDHMSIRPLLQYMMMLNTYNLPLDTELKMTAPDGSTQFGMLSPQDLHPDYDYEARYAAMEPALSKPARINQLVQLSTAWAKDPYVNQFEFKKAILELADMVDAERYLKNEGQVKGELNQERERGYTEEVVRAQWEDKSRREDNMAKLMGDVIKQK